MFKPPEPKAAKSPDPTVTALKNAHLQGGTGAKSHQNIARRKGLLVKALRGNRSAPPAPTDPQDTDS